MMGAVKEFPYKMTLSYPAKNFVRLDVVTSAISGPVATPFSQIKMAVPVPSSQISLL